MPTLSQHNIILTNPPTARLLSLDALRGITIAVMLVVNNPGSWSHIYPPLAHAAWDGCTLADLVFPLFLFSVGASMSLSFPRALLGGTTRGEICKRALLRGLILIALGIGLNILPLVLRQFFSTNAPDWSTLRPLGVLQRIGAVFIMCSALVLFLPRAWQYAAGFVILLGYTLIMLPAPVNPADNLAAWLDSLVIPSSHLYRGGPLDPEGLLSTLPAVVSSLLGFWIGSWVSSQPRTVSTASRMVALGTWLIIAGLAAGYVLPVNKELWTPAYVLLTTGVATAVWAMLYAISEVRSRARLLQPFIILGSNAIFAFVASGVVGRLLGFIQVGTPEKSLGATAYGAIAAHMSPVNASLCFALVTLVCWYFVHLALYRQQIFFKV